MALRIGLSYAPANEKPYPRYVEALRGAAARMGIEIETIDLWSNPDAATSVDGVLFTGGEDVAPERFGKGNERARCGTIREDRDEHEFRVLGEARKRELPLLGICRGLQLLNVAYGGSLITDIATAAEHTKKAGVDAQHGVAVTEKASLVRMLAGADRGHVNSSHHQAVDRLAEPFVVTARSANDDLVESFEWKDGAGKPFLLAVQWHPERMQQSEPLAGPVFERFLAASRASLLSA